MILSQVIVSSFLATVVQGYVYERRATTTTSAYPASTSSNWGVTMQTVNTNSGSSSFDNSNYVATNSNFGNTLTNYGSSSTGTTTTSSGFNTNQLNNNQFSGTSGFNSPQTGTSGQMSTVGGSTTTSNAMGNSGSTVTSYSATTGLAGSNFANQQIAQGGASNMYTQSQSYTGIQGASWGNVPAGYIPTSPTP